MVRIFLFVLIATISGVVCSAHADDYQIGGDFIVPYRVDSPKGRLAMMDGGHIDGYLNDSISFGVGAFFGLGSKGFVKKPIYIVPGMTFYLPFPLLSPFVRTNLPILVNNGHDIGLQGAGGLLLNLLAGLGLEYSVDAAYYFDSKAIIVNWVHIGAVYTF